MLANKTLLPLVCVALGGMAATLAGCGCSNDAEYLGYCDSTGCYVCSGPGDCWPVEHSACGTDNECPAGQKCTDIGCTFQCDSDEDCQNGEVCDFTSGLCAPDGVSPRPLGPDQTNPHPIEVPASCTTDEECKKADPTLVCDQGKCITACSSDDDCPEGYVCAPCGKCTPKDTPSCGDVRVYCDVNVPSSCGPNRACLAGHCHVTCDASTECPIGQICQAGVCVDDPNPQNPQCVFNADCTRAGQSAVCVHGYCHPTCEKDADCGYAEICNVGVCMPDYTPAH